MVQRLQSLVDWLYFFWAMVKQNIMEEGSGRGKLQSGSREGQEGAENQGMPPVSYIL
jgi:hypothetical protein